MIQRRKESGNPFGPLGIASLIVCFAVLCITVLSVSAFAAAKDELRDAEAVAAAQKNFYESDRLAAEKVRRLKAASATKEALSAAAKDEGAAVLMRDGVTLVAFGVPVDSTLTLSVLLSFEEKMEILSWQVLSSTDWTPEDSISVWQGITD